MTIPLFKIFAVIGLAMWVGGLTFFALVAAPTAFRSLPKEESARFIGALFPLVDRWSMAWGAVTSAALALSFLGRHFERRPLLIEAPVALMLFLALHSALTLHPQIRELKRKMALPEFKATAHRDSLEAAYKRYHKKSVSVHMLLLLLGVAALALVPFVLR